MCGINGIFAFHYAANPASIEEATRTRDYMAARGPDGAGMWASPDCRIVLGHRRLAIIDLSDAGLQPMTSSDGMSTIVFNGEIYNYRQLREDLIKSGRVFRTESDTEVLLHLYEVKGAEMVHHLRGMFAFAIWDARKGQLFLARDPYGIKPLYYSDDGWTFRFASQVKALLSSGTISRDPEPAGVTGFFLLGSVPEPYTTWQAIRCVPAGSSLVVDRIGSSEPVRYHSIAQVYSRGNAEARTEDVEGEIFSALLDSVRSHLVADVPVGAFLSAGVDSGSLVGLMRDAGAREIRTVTLGFSENLGTKDDERPIAREIAEYYGTDHYSRVVSQREFEEDIPSIMQAMDQPSIDGVNTWFVAKAAKEHGLKVAISGLGGDELMGGYPSFREIPQWVRWVQIPARVPKLGQLIRILASRMPGVVTRNPKLPGLIEYGGTLPGAYLLKRALFMPWELKDVLDPEMLRTGLQRLDPIGLAQEALDSLPNRDFSAIAALEASLYMRNQLLRDTDWTSMAHSLEVRVPFVDKTLLERLAPLSALLDGGVGKQKLARIPRRPLPKHVAERAKTGFTTPIGRWIGVSGSETVRGRNWARKWAVLVATKSQTV